MAATNEWGDHPAAKKHGDLDAFGIGVTRAEAIKIIASLAAQLNGDSGVPQVCIIYRHDRDTPQRFFMAVNDNVRS